MVVKEYKKPAGVYKVQTFRTTQKSFESKKLIFEEVVLVVITQKED